MVKVNFKRKDGNGQERLRTMLGKVHDEHVGKFLDDLDIPDWYRTRQWSISDHKVVKEFAKYLTKNKILNCKMYYLIGPDKKYIAMGIDIKEDVLYTKFLLEYTDD